MPTPAPAGALQDHLKGTYLAVRIGTAVVGAALPLLLWIGGALRDGEPLRGSMSAYYYSPAMRDVFVGGLVAVGLCLVLYKGFSAREDWALNLGGALAVLVAMVPTRPPGTDGSAVTAHGTFAVLFFACIAYVCVFRASDTLGLIQDTTRVRRYRTTYRVLGVAMIASPLIAFALNALFRDITDQNPLTFFIEAAGVWVFATYWLVKSRELAETDAERLAVEGKLKVAESSGSMPWRVVQVGVELDGPSEGRWVA